MLISTLCPWDCLTKILPSRGTRIYRKEPKQDRQLHLLANFINHWMTASKLVSSLALMP